jgi:hypothetical protein
MSDNARLVSKVLLLERDAECLVQLRSFCEANDLVGLKVQPDHVMSVLKSNVDLGGIFLAEDFGATKAAGRALAHAIHAVRPELPIFLRCEAPGELSDADVRVVRAVYPSSGIATLVPVIAESIFCLVYPNALVRGIGELTVTALKSQFKHVNVQAETPYIVRDRIIYGEICTLIPLESTWCRGYMMLQAKEEEIRHLLEQGEAADPSGPGQGFRDLNNTFGEVTNLIWVQEPLYLLRRFGRAPDAGPDRDQPPSSLHLVRLGRPSAVLSLHAERCRVSRCAADAHLSTLHLQPELVTGRP